MPRIQGVGPRIAARLVEMGFVRPDGTLNVPRFARAFDYDKTVVYEWVADRRTPTREVARLCADLQLSHGYLLYGEGEPEPYKPLATIGGGAGPCEADSEQNIIRNALQLLDFLDFRRVSYRTLQAIRGLIEAWALLPQCGPA